MNVTRQFPFQKRPSKPDLEGLEMTGAVRSAPRPVSAPVPRSLRILVVDDEEAIRVSLRMLLASDGHVVDAVGSGEEALTMFRDGHFDLVITDYSITGMDGPEFAATIKGEDATCPVVMITAYAQALPPALPCVEAIVSKPFSSEELNDAITQAMKPGSPSRLRRKRERPEATPL